MARGSGATAACALCPRALGQALFVSFGELLHFSAPRPQSWDCSGWGEESRAGFPSGPSPGAGALTGSAGFYPRKSLRRCPASATMCSLPRIEWVPIFPGSVLSPSLLGAESTGLDPQPHQLCASQFSPSGASESPPQYIGVASMNPWRSLSKKSLLATYSFRFHFFISKMRPIMGSIWRGSGGDRMRQGSREVGAPSAPAF